MQIVTNREIFNRLEISLSSEDFKKFPNWDNFVTEFLFRVINERQGAILLTREANKKSLLWDLGRPSKGKFEAQKFLWLIKNEINYDQCKIIAEDYEFYLGGFFIIFIDPKKAVFSDFLHHLFSSGTYYKFSAVEYIFMENDGESIIWINSNHPEKLLNQLSSHSINFNKLPQK